VTLLGFTLCFLVHAARVVVDGAGTDDDFGDPEGLTGDGFGDPEGLAGDGFGDSDGFVGDGLATDGFAADGFAADGFGFGLGFGSGFGFRSGFGFGVCAGPAGGFTPGSLIRSASTISRAIWRLT
jgi:hypothetical protein